MHPALYTRASMIREIAAAVGFISKFLRTKGLMNERQLQTFSQCLQELLAGEGGGCGGSRSPPVRRGPPARAGLAAVRAAPRSAGARRGGKKEVGPSEGLEPLGGGLLGLRGRGSALAGSLRAELAPAGGGGRSGV